LILFGGKNTDYIISAIIISITFVQV